MSFARRDTKMRSRASLFPTMLAACGAWVACMPASAAPAEPTEVFHGPAGVTGLLYPAATGMPRSAAVLIVHDTLGMDTRSQRYIAQLTAAGLVVVEVELGANPPDGMPEPLPGEAEAASLVARAATALADDPRVDRTRVAALGFGIGARSVVLAPHRELGRDPFVARILLYPGCGSLSELVQASERAAAAVLSPVLLMHGEDDPANSAAECEALSATLARTATVRRLSFREAGYAWDLPQVGGGEYSVHPWPGGQSWIPVHSRPELAELSAAQAAAFLAATLSRALLERSFPGSWYGSGSR